MKKLLSRILVMLTAAVLVTAALVTSCDGPIERIFQGAEEDNFIPYDPPANMGYIRIKLNNSRATFQPTIPTLTDLYYHVEIKDGVTTVEEVGTETTPVKLLTVTGRPIPVAPGTYTVNVYASTTASDSTVIGFGTKSGVNVTSGGGTVTIDLKPTYDEGDGVFTWDIALPSNHNGLGTSADFTLFKYGTTNKIELIPSKNVLDLTSGNTTGTLNPIPAGFYRIQIEMNSEDDYDPSGGTDDYDYHPPLFQDRTVTHVVHIAKNMTTDFTTILGDLNRYAYEVTYDHNDDPGDLEDSDTTVKGLYAHGTTFARLSPDPVNVDDSSYAVRGWYKTRQGAIDDTATLKWNFASDKIINDLILYAGWSAKVNLGLTINFDHINPPTVAYAGVNTFSQADLGATVESVTVSIALPTGFTVVSWKCQEILSWSNPTPTSNSVILSNTDANLAPYLAEGTLHFTVDLNYSEDSGVTNKPYDAEFFITITK
jgi:hypothetical protein